MSTLGVLRSNKNNHSMTLVIMALLELFLRSSLTISKILCNTTMPSHPNNNNCYLYEYHLYDVQEHKKLFVYLFVEEEESTEDDNNTNSKNKNKNIDNASTVTIHVTAE